MNRGRVCRVGPKSDEILKVYERDKFGKSLKRTWNGRGRVY